LCRWALDSGAFTELSMHGRYRFSAEVYAEEAMFYADRVGLLDFAVIMDWMCEPFVTARTGLSVAEHQERTVASYLELTALAPSVRWVPVVQGYSPEDYTNHLEMYSSAGIDLASLRLVGLGSVCRRQHTAAIECVVRHLYSCGLSLHAFGAKTIGLCRFADAVESADSAAWSFAARKRPPLPNCRHGVHGRGNCANCPHYALAWRSRLLASLPSPGDELPALP
jgi:hypothetical protein